MADFSSIALSDPTKHERAITALEQRSLSPADLLAREPRVVAARAGTPVLDTARLQRDVVLALRREVLGSTSHHLLEGSRTEWDGNGVHKTGVQLCRDQAAQISTLDDRLDNMLGGGLPLGYITEVVGER